MEQKCVHQSCGKIFTDPDEECVYHPGPPVFHEGQKGWKCCKPRVLTFDEFLSIPPCTAGRHSTTDRPPVLEKPQLDPATAPSPSPALSAVLNSAPGIAPRQPISLPSRSATASPAPVVEESDEDEVGIDISDGRPCKRRGCGHVYKAGDERKDEKCVHHPGAPLFHEGSKGYTCCKRKVLEFDEFMRIEGCKVKERHLFVGSGKQKGATKQNRDGEEILETVRHDFYQTPTTVIASFFLKKINKEAASVTFSSTELSLDLPTKDTPPKRYKNIINLFGPINTDESSFQILGTKLEVTLVKADGSSWPVLRSDEPNTGGIIQLGRAGRAT